MAEANLWQRLQTVKTEMSMVANRTIARIGKTLSKVNLVSPGVKMPDAYANQVGKWTSTNNIIADACLHAGMQREHM